MGEIIFLAVLEAAFIYLYTTIASFPQSLLDNSGGAGLFPGIILIMLIVLIPLRIIKIIFKQEKEKFVFKEMFQGTRFLYLSSLVISTILMPVLGYTVSMSLFLALVINSFYYKVHGKIGAVKSVLLRNVILVGFVFLLKVFFTNILVFRFPTGIFGF